MNHSRSVVTLSFVMVSLVVAGCSSGYKVAGGDGKSTPNGVVVPNGSFFEDDPAGREFSVQLDATASQLTKIATDPNLGAKVGTSVKQFSELFDQLSVDLRSTYQASYHGLVAGLSVSKSPEVTRVLLLRYQDLIERASARTVALRAVSAQIKSLATSPSETALASVHASIRELVKASAGAKETTVDPKALGTGIPRYADELAGVKVNGEYLWALPADGSASLVVPIESTGETRITGMLDKTPFMTRERTLTCTLINVDAEGLKAFRAFMKSNIPFDLASLSGEDGNRHVDPNSYVLPDQPVRVQQVGPRDASYYLAWRGNTMSREEFTRRYPSAMLKLELAP